MKSFYSFAHILFAISILTAAGCSRLVNSGNKPSDGGSKVTPDADANIDTGSSKYEGIDADMRETVGADANAFRDGDANRSANTSECGDVDPDPSCHRYVNASSSSDIPNGLSWEKAFRKVQEGIDSASGNSSGCQVWVARGRYYIFEDSWKNTVLLQPNVYIYMADSPETRPSATSETGRRTRPSSTATTRRATIRSFTW